MKNTCKGETDFLSCYIATNCYFDFNYTVTAEPNVTHLFTDRPKGS